MVAGAGADGFEGLPLVCVWDVLVDASDGVELSGYHVEFGGGDGAAVDVAFGLGEGLDEGEAELRGRGGEQGEQEEQGGGYSMMEKHGMLLIIWEWGVGNLIWEGIKGGVV